MPRLYSRQDIRKTYELIQEHMRTKAIIREHALNRRDIREVALEGLDLSGVRRVLDLGCGYGFFTEKLQGRLHQGAHILGIDLVDRENRRVFLQTVKDIGYEGEFVRSRADIIRSMDESSFDMAIASYSLYFFPHLVGAIARVLSPEGVFVAVTHSKYSLREVTSFVPRCMERMGIVPPAEIMINRLFRAFSLEEGEEMLSPFFGRVERVIYENDLLFPLDRIGECIDYLDKKKHLIFKEVMENHPQKVGDMVSYFNDMVFAYAKEHGRIVLTKDDAVFRCFRPRRRG
ncbi:MAG TPA: methyltransferase domain-containing protein [Deltaproteobacteria bacterium]|nr:methyltransferase domain-containing protein [Deltaproteobacteria bacterium]